MQSCALKSLLTAASTKHYPRIHETSCHDLAPQMQDVAVFHYHHIHKHVILALCRGVLHSAAVSLLIQPKVKTAKSSKKTVSKSEDVLMKVCRDHDMA